MYNLYIIHSSNLIIITLQIRVLVPKNFRVESAQQVRDLNADKAKLGGLKYLLKSIPYDPAHRGDLFTLPAKPEALDR